MFNWLGNIFPYSDLHSLNLDWLLSKMKETATQAAQAIADSAKALTQVIEAKTAAQNAQTAAQNAQTAANNAQTAANNAADSAENAVAEAQEAKSAAQTAQNTANTAQSAAQTAQSAAQSAQTAAQNAQNTANTAQSTAETAQSAAETATSGVNTLNSKFPIKSADIASGAVTTPKIGDGAVTPTKLDTKTSYLNVSTSGKLSFPHTGHADFAQITAGIDISGGSSTFDNLRTSYLQFGMDILEPGSTSPNTKFYCVAPLIKYIQKSSVGIVAVAPILIVNKEINEMFHGSMILSRINDSGNTASCKVVFESNPNFTANSEFILHVVAVGATIGRIIG